MGTGSQDSEKQAEVSSALVFSEKIFKKFSKKFCGTEKDAYLCSPAFFEGRGEFIENNGRQVQDEQQVLVRTRTFESVDFLKNDADGTDSKLIEKNIPRRV